MEIYKISIESDNQTNNTSIKKTIIEIIKISIVPIAIAYATIFYTNSQKEAERNLKYIELSINILKDKPNDDTKSLRKWATTIIGKYAPIHLENEIENSLINKIPISKATDEDIMAKVYGLNNVHYFHWTKEDQIYTLDIEILRDGKWEVLESVCPAYYSYKIGIPYQAEARWRVSVGNDNNKTKWWNIKAPMHYSFKNEVDYDVSIYLH